MHNCPKNILIKTKVSFKTKKKKTQQNWQGGWMQIYSTIIWVSVYLECLKKLSKASKKQGKSDQVKLVSFVVHFFGKSAGGFFVIVLIKVNLKHWSHDQFTTTFTWIVKMFWTFLNMLYVDIHFLYAHYITFARMNFD